MKQRPAAVESGIRTLAAAQAAGATVSVSDQGRISTPPR
jgi:hypothetical protein